MIHKKISDLQFSVQPKFQRALKLMNENERLKELGVESIAVNETLRDLPTQMAYFVCGRMEVKYVKAFYTAAGLYDIGDIEAMSIKTKTLSSNHMSGRAADFVPAKNGKPWWDAPEEVWQIMGEIGESCGLKWGGRWKDFPDSPHFEA